MRSFNLIIATAALALSGQPVLKQRLPRRLYATLATGPTAPIATSLLGQPTDPIPRTNAERFASDLGPLAPKRRFRPR